MLSGVNFFIKININKDFYPQRKERKEYDEAKDKHDLLLKKVQKETEKLIADDKKMKQEIKNKR